MKKLIMSAVALTLISFASVQATPVTEPNHAITVTQEKVSVKPEDLPAAIKATINSDAFAGWKVTTAYLVTNDDKTQYYDLSVKKGSENARVKLDKNGKNVE
ncbi:hypothetical protein [Dyadobacter frigoris]|uniref:PepSY domain-containing protein n=1 Tax=Dyadobacter frigoris TaxID=2576211 RepID=A0A4U6D316_9BACT|nr:hypothetical protein [Dyadobacter frigoris]TKT90258.1 hypothetical protein FDK13_21205 [Dyadobacter frigoris]